MNVNDCFSHELGGDTLSEYIYSNVKKKTKGDYFPSLNSEDLIGQGVGDSDPINWADEYFTTEALTDGTISFNVLSDMGTDYITSISYSTDNGETWTTTNNTNNKQENLQIAVNVSSGNTVLWKGIAEKLSIFSEYFGDYVGSFFLSTCNINVYGNVMSLLYGDNFINQTSIENKIGCFTSLFHDLYRELSCNVVDASKLILPATTLARYCYQNMFNGCGSLTSAPELPATTLAEGCYNGMFEGCSSLNYIKAMFTTTPSTSYTENWVRSVASSGTFVKNSSATWTTTGVNGIPTNWTVETA